MGLTGTKEEEITQTIRVQNLRATSGYVYAHLQGDSPKIGAFFTMNAVAKNDNDKWLPRNGNGLQITANGFLAFPSRFNRQSNYISPTVRI